MTIPPNKPWLARGIIKEVDPLEREILVQVDGDIVILDVPVTCPVFVNNEQVKLHFLQSGDRVWLRLQMGRDRAIAQSIQVRPYQRRKTGLQPPTLQK